MYYASFEVLFCAAHRLPPPYQGKCGRIHGHNYKANILIGALQLDDKGMVTELATVRDYINSYDHRLILWDGDKLAEDLMHIVPEDWIVTIGVVPTTERLSEHMAADIFDICQQENDAVTEIEVTLAETHTVTAYGRYNSWKDEDILPADAALSRMP